MKNIELYFSKKEDYWYEQKLKNDSKTMNYNASYHYDKKCDRYECGILIDDKYRSKNIQKKH